MPSREGRIREIWNVCVGIGSSPPRASPVRWRRFGGGASQKRKGCTHTTYYIPLGGTIGLKRHHGTTPPRQGWVGARWRPRSGLVVEVDRHE